MAKIWVAILENLKNDFIYVLFYTFTIQFNNTVAQMITRQMYIGDRNVKLNIVKLLFLCQLRCTIFQPYVLGIFRLIYNIFYL